MLKHDVREYYISRDFLLSEGFVEDTGPRFQRGTSVLDTEHPTSSSHPGSISTEIESFHAFKFNGFEENTQLNMLEEMDTPFILLQLQATQHTNENDIEYTLNETFLSEFFELDSKRVVLTVMKRLDREVLGSLFDIMSLLSRNQITSYTLVITGLGVFDNTGVDTGSLTRLLLGFPGLL